MHVLRTDLEDDVFFCNWSIAFIESTFVLKAIKKPVYLYNTFITNKRHTLHTKQRDVETSIDKNK